MNDPLYRELVEMTWQRKLTTAEEAQLQNWLTAHPEARADFEAESGLNHLLDQLPKAPKVASNFTALVLQQVERESAAIQRSQGQSAWAGWRRLLPRFALAALVLTTGLMLYGNQVSQKRELARTTARFSQLVAKNKDVLEDFEAISKLDQRQPKADMELLALLQ